MNQFLNQLAFGWYPYLAVTTLIVGSILRFDADQFSWRSQSSQFLRRKQMIWGSNLMHLGIIVLFFGHLIGLMTPVNLLDTFGIGHGFTILDRSDAEDLVNLVRSQLGLSDKDKRFPRKGTIAEIFGKCENTLQPIEGVVLNEFAHFSEFLEDLIKLKAAYETQKQQRQLLDYDDLLVKLSLLLTDAEGAGGKVAEQFRYILVDEYQDTNRLQAQLIRRLARGSRACAGSS